MDDRHRPYSPRASSFETGANNVVELSGLSKRRPIDAVSRRADDDEITAFFDRSALAPARSPKAASSSRDVTPLGGVRPRFEEADSVTTFAVRSSFGAPAEVDAAESYEAEADPAPSVPPSRQRHFNPNMETLFAKVADVPASQPPPRAPLGNTAATPVRPVEAMLAKRRPALHHHHDFSLFQPMPPALMHVSHVVAPSQSAHPMRRLDVPTPSFQPPIHAAQPGFQPMPAMRTAPRTIPPPESSVRPWIMGGDPSSGFGSPLRTPPRLTPSAIATASIAFLAAVMFVGGFVFLFLRSEPNAAPPPAAAATAIPEAAVLPPASPPPVMTALPPTPAVTEPPSVTVSTATPVAIVPSQPAPSITAPAASPRPPLAQPVAKPPVVVTARRVSTPPPPAARRAGNGASKKSDAKSVEDILNELGEEQLRR